MLSSPIDFLWLLILGLVAGASGGLLGIGGSTVMIPGMVVLFGSDRQHLYQASAMVVNFFVVAPAVIRHMGVGATFPSVTRWMVPSAVAGAILGVFVSERPIFRGAGQGYLQIGFGAFLIYVIAYNIFRIRSGVRFPKMDQAAAAKLPKTRIVGLVGLPAGFLGGLLGVGGGLVAVPAQQIGLRIPLTNAIANSASTILWSSIVGAIVKNSRLAEHGYTIGQSILLTLCLAPTAVIGSWYTSAKVHQWPVRVIRSAFVLLLVYCSARLLMAGWRQLQS